MATQQTVVLIDSIHCLRSLFMKIRDKNSNKVDFVRHSKRLMRIICEEGISYANPQPSTVITPTGSEYSGDAIDLNNLVAISVIRAADSMLDTFLEIAPEATVGKILIQRDEETALPKLFYSKLPPLANKVICLLDPMLATGGSAIAAIEVLVKAGADPSQIMFLNVLSCPEGIAALNEKYPQVRIVTGEIDPQLDEKRYIIPGLGDFGDRFFGTVAS